MTAGTDAQFFRSSPLPGWRSGLLIAWYELMLSLLGAQGWIIALVFSGTFGIGVASAAAVKFLPQFRHVELAFSYANTLAWLSVPLTGLVLGYGLIAEEREFGTIHFIGTRPVSRGLVLFGKFLGKTLALLATLGASALLASGLAYAYTGRIGNGGHIIGYLVSLVLVGLVFLSLSLLFSAVFTSSRAALLSSAGAYLFLSVGWQNLFRIPANPSPGDAILGLISPFVAWLNWADEVIAQPHPWKESLIEQVTQGYLAELPFYATIPFYAVVNLVWIVGALLLAVWVFSRRDAA